MTSSLLVMLPANNSRDTTRHYSMDLVNEINSSSGETTPMQDTLDAANGDCDSPAKIIEEAKNILLRRSSYQDDDRPSDRSVNTHLPLSDYNQSAQHLIVNQLYSELPNTNDFKDLNGSRVVKFNLELNQTYEYDTQHDVDLDSNSDSDSDPDSGSTNLFSIGDASELAAIDHDIQLDNARVRVAFADDVTYIETSNDKTKSPVLPDLDSSPSDTNISESEKQKLKTEILELRLEYEEELLKLRKDYEARREDYMTELEEINDEVARKRLLAGRGMSEADVDDAFETKLQQLKQEKEEIKEFEEMLKSRKEFCLEQQQQVDDYEKYLDRRHESLTDKEEDLKTLQDELQELSVALRRRERELKEKSNRISVEEERIRPRCDCNQSKEETDGHIIDLRGELERTREELAESRRENENLQTKVSSCEAENRRLQTKLKQLDSQLSLQLRINDKDRRSSLLPAHSNGNLATMSSHQLTSSTLTEERDGEPQHRQLSRTCSIM